MPPRLPGVPAGVFITAREQQAGQRTSLALHFQPFRTMRMLGRDFADVDSAASPQQRFTCQAGQVRLLIFQGPGQQLPSVSFTCR